MALGETRIDTIALFLFENANAGARLKNQIAIRFAKLETKYDAI